MSDAATIGDDKTSSPQSDKWQRISPASVIYFVLKFVGGILRNGFQAVAPVAAVIATAGDNRWFALALLAAGAGTLLLVGSLLSYLNFKFRMDRDAFLIRSGVFTRKRLSLTFDRIQNVAIKEPLYFRPLGLVVLALESAGSSSEEVSLAGIPRRRAQEIRQFVLERKSQPAVSEPERDEETNDRETSGPQKPTEDLLKLPISELVRYGISNNNIWVFAGLAAAFFSQLDEVWESAAFRDYFSGMGDMVGNSVFAITVAILFLIVSILLLLLLASIIGAIVVNYRYHLTYSDGRYHRTRGLFERQETSVPEVKVQSLRINQPLIARLISRHHLTLNQVGFEGKQGQGRSQKFIIPSVEMPFIRALSHKLFDASDLLDQPLNPISGRFVARHALYTFGAPALLLAFTLANAAGWVGLAPIAALLLIVPMVLLRKRRYGYARNDAYGIVQSGLFGKQATVFPFFKVQTVAITQSPGQRKHGLANLKIKLAGRTIRIPYMPLSDARAWRADIMQAIKSSDKPWM